MDAGFEAQKKVVLNGSSEASGLFLLDKVVCDVFVRFLGVYVNRVTISFRENKQPLYARNMCMQCMNLNSCSNAPHTRNVYAQHCYMNSNSYIRRMQAILCT